MIRLFVAGFPREAGKADLARVFQQYGTQEADVTFPKDRRSRRKKGYAYVNVSDERAAQAAIAAFHGFEIAGKALTVVRAEDRPLKRARRPSGRS